MKTVFTSKSKNADITLDGLKYEAYKVGAKDAVELQIHGQKLSDLEGKSEDETGKLMSDFFNSIGTISDKYIEPVGHQTKASEFVNKLAMEDLSDFIELLVGINASEEAK